MRQPMPGDRRTTDDTATTNVEQVPLLATKLFPPRLSSAVITRERLLDQLDRALGSSMVLIRAPAGFGKTTLVNQWLVSRALRPNSPAVAWLSLDRDDSEPVRFLRYVIAACQTLQPGVGQAALASLNALRSPLAEPISVQPALTLLLNDLAQLPHRGVLVLENYQVIDSPQVHNVVAFLLEHLPSALHLFLITRSDPPLPLMLLRANGDLYELHASDLRFSYVETYTFLEQSLSCDLPPDVITQIEARTEGWAAGLRLAVMTFQRSADPREIVHRLETLRGSQQHIAEYLATAVLAAQPAPIQDFLLETSILPYLSGALCDAVLERSDSAEVLSGLSQAELFLEPLDASDSGWYRYSGLFGEAMRHEARRRISEDQLRVLYERAYTWFIANRMYADAIDAALAAGAYERAALLLEQRIAAHENVFEPHEPHILRRWLEQMPETLLRTHPTLCFGYTIVLMRTADRPVAEIGETLLGPLTMAETAWRSLNAEPSLGAAFTLRALIAFWQGQIGSAVYWSRSALRLLPEQEDLYRGIALGFVGGDELQNGQFAAARKTIADARERTDTSDNMPATRAHTLLLGEVCAGQAELHLAAELYRQVLAHAEGDRLDLARVHIDLADLAYEWNELDSAWRNASTALELSEQLEDEILQVRASLLLARIEHVRGATSEAQQRLIALLARLQPTRTPLLYDEVLLWQCRLLLSAGNLPGAQRLLSIRTQYRVELPPLEQELEDVVLARLMIAQREGRDALRVLELSWARATAAGRTRASLEILVLMARAYTAEFRTDEANRALRDALAGACADDFRRLFLDEGELLVQDLSRLLPNLHDPSLRAYVQELLKVQAADRAQDTQLSPQELRVLSLLVAGRSNKEIAQEFVVSINTIKTQLKSIYRKLNVNSRRDACAIARQLHLD